MVEVTRKDFLQLTLGAVVTASSAPISASATLPDAAVRRSSIARQLIRNVTLLSMDDKLGSIPRCDVLIQGSKIAAVQPDLTAGDAEIIDGAGMILMPGMIDGHRHLWQDIAKNYLFSNYMRDGHLRYALQFRPEELYLAEYIGGLTAIDSGVTSVVDFCHAIHDPEQGDAAARGIKASGVGGVFCYQLPVVPPGYGPGSRLSAADAWERIMGPADPSQVKGVAHIRDQYFGGSEDVLSFGIALTAAEFSRRTVEQARAEFAFIDQLQPQLVVQHVLGTNGDWHMGLDRSFRLIPDYYRAGLLRPGYMAVHGNGLSDDELKMLRDSGSSVCSTPLGEHFYSKPSIHARASALGLAAAIGADTTGWQTHDYFDHVRAARTGLCRDDRDVALARTFSAQDYLKFATIGGAKAIGQDARIGSIVPGKRADLVLINAGRDFFPLAGDPASRVFGYSGVGDVDSVWVAGTRRKAKGKVLGVDWPELQERAARVWARMVESGNRITLDGVLSNTFPTLRD